MMVFELIYLGVVLLRVVLWFIRVLLKLHAAMILVALPAGLLVRAGRVDDVQGFAIVSCTWAALLLCLWTARAACRRRTADLPCGSGRSCRGATHLRGPRFAP